MKIKDFLRENNLSVGDNVSFLLEKLGLDKDGLLRKLETSLGESAKMSKSKANTVDPEETINKYGADTVRLYILFSAPPEQDFEWTEEGIQGAHRFLNRLWNFVMDRIDSLKGVEYSREDFKELPRKERELRRFIHETLKSYLQDMEQEFQFNTAIAKAMKLLNELSSYQPADSKGIRVLKEGTDILILMLAPIVPHICSELWERLRNKGLLVTQSFPEVDPEALKKEEVEIPVQVNGKLRAKVKVPYDADEDTVRRLVFSEEKLKKHLSGKEVKKFIYIRNKVVNIVVS